jgi:hypothetical protein
MSIRFIGRLRALLLATCLAGALALPTAAFAMPIDNGPAPSNAPVSAPASPQIHTIIERTGDTLAIALAGAALLVAMASAGYIAVRLTPRRVSS